MFKKYGNDFFKTSSRWIALYIQVVQVHQWHKKYFDALGGFDVRLDMGAAGYNGDSGNVVIRIIEGWEVKYDPHWLFLSYA